jgi:hypothetical protein
MHVYARFGQQFHSRCYEFHTPGQFAMLSPTSSSTHQPAPLWCTVPLHRSTSCNDRPAFAKRNDISSLGANLKCIPLITRSSFDHPFPPADWCVCVSPSPNFIISFLLSVVYIVCFSDFCNYSLN